MTIKKQIPRAYLTLAITAIKKNHNINIDNNADELDEPHIPDNVAAQHRTTA